MEVLVKVIIKSSTDAAVSEREKRNAALARRAAAEGIVLLENDGALPIRGKRVALFGAGARRTISGGAGSGATHPRHVVTIEQGLKNAGYDIVTQAWLDRYDRHYDAQYAEWKRSIEARAEGISNPMAVIGIAAANRFCFPVGLPVEEDELQEADAAVYVLMRQGGEGADRRNQKGDFLLDDVETQTLHLLASRYPKTVLVIHVGGLVDLSSLDDIPINAVVFYVQGGAEGGNALADVLSGKVCPSGRLSCTWAKAYRDYPTAGGFSHEGDPLHQTYREGIYVGYRYFDTAGVAPRYEFGYGLSYTSFDLQAGELRQEGDALSLEVTVCNVGGCSGREVVQLYVSVPERAGGAEYQRLAAFQKTKVLAPRESEKLTLRFPLADCASYSPAPDGGRGAWWLIRGDYTVRLGVSSRKTAAVAIFCLSENVCTEECESACRPASPVSERYVGSVQRTAPHMKKLVIDCTRIAKCVHDYTVPGAESATALSLAKRLSDEELVALTAGAGLHCEVPVTALGASGNTTGALYEKYGIPNIVLSDGPAGLNLTPEVVETPQGVRSTQLYPQYDFGACRALMLRRLGKPEDGTMRYQYATALPVGLLLAQTWDVALLREVGAAVADEMLEMGVTVWLAPGMNILRNPLCGRTFEYYSEDPLLAGSMAASLTEGVQSRKGCFVSVKHFACNNCEEERHHSSSDVNERALREIYLRAFRIAVEAKPRTVMASYNKINGVYNTNNFDLLVKILRSEWGFQGLVMSDWDAVGGDGGGSCRGRPRSVRSPDAGCSGVE